MKNTIITLATVAAFTGSVNAQNLLADGGFEATGVTDSSSIFNYPAFSGSVTSVSNSAFYRTTGGVSGGFIDILQNGGANQQAFWNEVSHNSPGYQRIAMIANVNANQAYDLSFFHNSALDRFGYTGDTTLLQVQSLNTNQAFNQLFTTPDNTWTQENFSFTTDASTTQVAILFSSVGTSNSSTSIDSVALFAAGAVPEPSSTALLGLGALGLLARRKR